ncbi:hypothetical protein LC605_04545 [Nostoc sp. CHAB 5836]|uniref:hypothetical protein n=1 Tax=Nostoc sp. CHAB 5836 TaxID=2780404 RepID=UPI001E338D2D|nr:hypothetical protein [Nostoc sp. CHAB 5836]MCC5614358.1 hypothetical protein [Nostoc sp. CHAB 5836]
MTIRKIFSTAVFASLLMPAILNSGAATASENKCLRESATYIISLESASGFAGRGVLSFEKDGTLAVTSSSQDGGNIDCPQCSIWLKSPSFV